MILLSIFELFFQLIRLMTRNYTRAIAAFILISLIADNLLGQNSSNEVKVIGEMKQVMWKGQLEGTIKLDTISKKTHLFGLGPVEFLTGEILIIDGRSYKSTVVSDTTMRVEETFEINAPFFGYANISEWEEHTLPDSIQTIPQIEYFLDHYTKNIPRPFMFKMSGMVKEATIHIMNLPKGFIVRSPADAHSEQVNYQVTNEEADIIGFFSTEHQSIFTHHDTYLHMHLITTDLKKMGHLDDMLLEGGAVKLYLPAE